MSRYVNLNQNRVCSCCGRVIFTGTWCLTYCSSRKGRSWVCNSCEKLLFDKAVSGIDAKVKLTTI